MIRLFCLIGSLALIASVTGYGVSPCPVPNHPGNVHAGISPLM